MQWLNRLTAKQLFFGLLVFNAAVLMLVGLNVIRFQSGFSIERFQEESIDMEVSAVRSLMESHVSDSREFARLVASSDISANLVMGSMVEERRVKDFFDQSSVFARRPDLAYVNVAEEIVFSEYQLDLSEEAFLSEVQAILGQQKREAALLWEQQGRQYLYFFYGVEYNNYVEGVVLTRQVFDAESVFRFVTEKETRSVEGAPQNQSEYAVRSDHPDWDYHQLVLSNGKVTLIYGIDKAVLQAQSDGLISSLTFALLVAILISAAMIFWMGQRWVIRPFAELARSESALSETSSQLASQEVELTMLANVARHAKDTVIVTDKEGHLSWANASFVSLTGYQVDEVLGKKPGSILQGRDTDYREVDRIRQAIARRESIRAELLNYSKSGEAYWIEIEVSPVLNAEGELDSFIAVERDISAQKEVQQQLEEALAKANEASEAKSTFLAGISHEIRTPMNGVLGIVQLLKTTSLSDRQEQYVDNLYDSVNHMTSVLNQVIDYAKIEDESLNVFLEEFAAREVTNFIEYNLNLLCRRKGLRAQFDSYLPPDAHYVSDKIRVNQVVLNIISNATKFTQDGSISVVVDEVSKDDGHYLRFVVTDTGEGMNSFYLNALMNDDGAESLGAQQKDLGLGLAIVKALTRLLKGNIQVSSALEEGTVFTVELAVEPVEPKLAAESEMKEVRGFNAQGKSLLIVESDRVNAEVMAELLEARGFRAVIASTGEEAMNLIYTYPFSLVIVDSHLSDTQGKRIVERIRKLDSHMRDVLIIGYTSDAQHNMEQRLLNAGCEAVLVKPFQTTQVDDLLRQFESQLNRHQDE
ncbi:PAS domain-containing hybrid sensor histidine kinase/response regulator [Thaumasiovibrio subtropicus]|uniref:PAS domain-containing hybrid sensor histidine kinase/response regulator n=1 Tax=Thaumasiovibrio subtropicus TaxID=1891207 RepID=UPI000B354645|nr:histidine kinase dimerization/phospho-acceptor domain-containing protein [Thaumasiovibrio subtropicus]